jgi:hypothetical protein
MLKYILPLLLFWSSVARSDDFVVFPDSFEFAENDGAPDVSFRDMGAEIQVTLRLKASEGASLSILRSRYGEAFSNLNLIHVNVLPKQIDFMSRFFTKDNPALLSSLVQVDVNSISVQLRFSHDYTIAQLRESLLFPISLATVDAKILCLGSVSFGCDQTTRRIPVVNQFAIRGNDELTLKRAHYVYLRNYAANLVLTQEPFLSESFAADVREHRFVSGRCAEASKGWDEDACLITLRYSPSASIREAIMFLAGALYPKEALDTNSDYFLFGEDKLKVAYINLSLDFERIRSELDQRSYLHYEGRLSTSIPLVKSVSMGSTLHFQIQPNSLYFECQEMVLRSGKHLRGRSDLTFAIAYLNVQYLVPVQCSMVLGFHYNPISKTVTLEDVAVADWEFLATSGVGYEFAMMNRDRIQAIVNSALNSPDMRARIAQNIQDTLNQIQALGIDFEPIVHG